MKNVINFPINIDDGSEFEGFLPSPITEKQGIVAMSMKDGGRVVLRLYIAKRSSNKDNFEVEQELEAFSFENKDRLIEFMKKLPEMSGIDMLILLNSQ